MIKKYLELEGVPQAYKNSEFWHRYPHGLYLTVLAFTRPRGSAIKNRILVFPARGHNSHLTTYGTHPELIRFRAQENWYERRILHNLQTCEDYPKTYYLLGTAKFEAERKKIRKETGANRVSIWSLLPYFDMGRAIPGRYMHAICINLIKAPIT
jgi:hypothetical protein